MKNKSALFSQFKIKTILLITMILLVSLPLIISGSISTIILEKNNEKSFQQQGNSLCNVAENIIKSRISEYEGLLDSIISNGSFQDENYIKGQLVKDMNLIGESHKQIVNVYFGGDNGDFIQTLGIDLPEDYDHKTHDWYIDCKNNPSKIRVDKPYQDSLTGKMITTIYKAVEKNGVFCGVIAMDVELNDLSESLSKIKYGTNGDLLVVDPEEEIIIFSGDESKLGSSEATEYKVWSEIQNNDTGRVQFTYDGVEYETLYITTSINDWKIILRVPTDEFRKSVSTIIFNNFITMIILAGIAISIGVALAKVLSNTIINLKENMEQASEGKFNQEFNYNSNIYEFKVLIDSFKSMNTNIYRLISNVDKSIDSVNENSNEAFDISKQISDSIGQVSGTINQISQGNVECSSNLQHISDNMNELSQSISEINTTTNLVNDLSSKTDDLSSYGMKMIDVIKEKSVGTKESSEEVKRVVSDVAESIESIGLMNATISNITAQTNLLALNAAIEAARAGETGNGFAVVAEEIRKLAEETEISAKQIEKVIKDIKEKSNIAVCKVNETTDLVTDQEDVIRESTEVFDGISSSVQDLTGKISDISKEMNSINEMKDDILNKVENLSAILQETAAGSEEVTASAEEVSATTTTFISQFNDLKDTVDNLKIEIYKFEI